MANYNLFDAASLAMVPVGYKANKLYSVKPDTGAGDFDFSRASYATRVNADGLIEKERGNLLLQSNKFDTTWFNNNTTDTSGQSGYDGLNDAWKIETTNVSSAECRVRQDSVTISTGVQSVSFYAKAGSLNVAYAQVVEGSNNIYWLVNLSTGATNYIQGAGTAHIAVTAEDVGNGWYRLTGTWLSGSTTASIRLGLTNSMTNPYLTSPAGEYIYIQDAQLEQGLVATEYIETTTAPIYKGVTDNIPRIDYTSGCGSLLLEPSRTNLLPDSEYIANWAGANTTVVTNAAISPEGLQNASSVTFASGGYWYKSVSISYTAGQAYSWSIYTTTQDTITRWGGSTPAGTDTLSIEDAGNGWYRQTLTRVVSGSGTANFQPLMDAVFVGVGTTFYVYGAQLEAGSYPTSYIPTYGSSVTRLVEQAIKTIGTSYFPSNGFSVFLEADITGDTVNNFADIYQIAGGSTQFRLETRTNGLIYMQQGNMVVSGDNFNAWGLCPTTAKKLCFTFSPTQVKAYVDGVLLKTFDGVYTFSPIDTVNFAMQSSSVACKQTLLFSTALTDTELAALTRPYDTYQEWVDGEGLTWESKTCTTKSILNLQNL
jgi:hypothetical protein